MAKRRVLFNLTKMMLVLLTGVLVLFLPPGVSRAEEGMSCTDGLTPGMRTVSGLKKAFPGNYVCNSWRCGEWIWPDEVCYDNGFEAGVSEVTEWEYSVCNQETGEEERYHCSQTGGDGDSAYTGEYNFGCDYNRTWEGVSSCEDPGTMSYKEMQYCGAKISEPGAFAESCSTRTFTLANSLCDSEPTPVSRRIKGSSIKSPITSVASNNYKYFELPRARRTDSIVSSNGENLVFNDPDSTYDKNHYLTATPSQGERRTYQKVRLGYSWPMDDVADDTETQTLLIEKYGYNPEGERVWTEPYFYCDDIEGGCPGGSRSDNPDKVLKQIYHASRTCATTIFSDDANGWTAVDLDTGGGAGTLWKRCSGIEDENGSAATVWRQVEECAGRCDDNNAVCTESDLSACSNPGTATCVMKDDYYPDSGGVGVDEALESDNITIPAFGSAVLTWLERYEFRNNTDGGNTFLELTADGSNWELLNRKRADGEPINETLLAPFDSGNDYGWVAFAYDLAAYRGRTINVRLRFETTNSTSHTKPGWAVKDMVVTLEGCTDCTSGSCTSEFDSYTSDTDDQGQLYKSRQPVSGTGGSVVYLDTTYTAYSKPGAATDYQPGTVTDPNGIETDFVYLDDTAATCDGLVDTVTVNNDTDWRTDYDYRCASGNDGQLDLVTLPGGLKLDYAYDGNDKLEWIKIDDSVGTTSNPAIKYATSVSSDLETSTTLTCADAANCDDTGDASRVQISQNDYTNSNRTTLEATRICNFDKNSSCTYGTTDAFTKLEYETGTNGAGNLERVTQARTMPSPWSAKPYMAYDYTYTPVNSGTIGSGGTNVDRLLTNVTATISSGTAEKLADYTYNGRDELNSVKIYHASDSSHSTTSYTYDDFDRLLKVVSPDTGTTHYRYGNFKCDGYSIDQNRGGPYDLTQKLDANGTVTWYGYDLASRLTSVDWQTGLSSSDYDDGANCSTPDITYTYDLDSGTSSDYNYGKGRLSKVVSPDAEIRYQYDQRGSITQEKLIVGSDTMTTKYEYNDAGNLTRMVYPSGRTVCYAYDTFARVASVTTAPTDVACNHGSQVTAVSGITYAPLGDWTHFDYANGVDTDLTYNKNYEITQIEAELSSTDVWKQTLTYDADGNVLTNWDNIGNQTHHYDYDGLNRLKFSYLDSEASTGVSYTYDRAGNRTGWQDKVGWTGHEYYYDGGTSKGSAVTSNRAEDVVMGTLTSTPGSPGYRQQKGSALEAVATDSDGAASRLDALASSGGTSYNEWMAAAQSEISALAAKHGVGVRHRLLGLMLKGGLSKWRALADASDGREGAEMNSTQRALAQELIDSVAGERLPGGARARQNFETPEDHDLDLVYDGNGNIVEILDNDNSDVPLAELQYTPDNRLKKAIYDPDSAATTVGQYKYDAFGRRVSKQAYDDEVVKFAYDLSGNMIYEFETSGDELYKEYIYINGHRVLMIAPDGAGQLGGCATAGSIEFVWVSLLGVGAVLLVLRRKRGGLVLLVLGGIAACGDVAHREMIQSSLSSTDGFYFYHNDHLDTPHALTDFEGTVVWSATYTDFGEDISVSGPGSYVQNFRFPGQYADWETGLYYNWHRYYFPAMGRYVTADPILEYSFLQINITSSSRIFRYWPSRGNPYSYALNSPNHFIDSKGLICKWWGRSSYLSLGVPSLKLHIPTPTASYYEFHLTSGCCNGVRVSGSYGVILVGVSWGMPVGWGGGPAEFLGDNTPDVDDPTGTALLEAGFSPNHSIGQMRIGNLDSEFGISDQLAIDLSADGLIGRAYKLGDPEITCCQE